MIILLSSKKQLNFDFEYTFGAVGEFKVGILGQRVDVPTVSIERG